MALNAPLKLAILTAWPSQGEFAKAIGMHSSRLSQIIRGHVRPTDAEVSIIVARLPGVEARVLFPGVAA